MNKQPEIAEKTRQKFIDAFWALVREKPISKIAVNEITRRAGYNRSTFYEYFLDIDEMLSYIEDELLNEIRQTAQDAMQESSSMRDLFQTVFLAMNEKIYLLMGANGDPAFAAKLREELEPIIMCQMPVPADIPNFDYLSSFVNDAMFGLLQHWNEKGKDISAEKICTMMQELVLNGVINYVTKYS
ncbi:MAG: TetR/AcrR family transcriptional regulator [Lachnospiraceae bacterium]|nr:TetR/AcrR family transcriptional regulator [Lachnospiraceae bacterium]